MNDFQFGQIVILITTLITLGVQLYRETRDRKWHREDREEKKAINKRLDESSPAVLVRREDAIEQIKERRKGTPADRRRDDPEGFTYEGRNRETRRLGDREKTEQATRRFQSFVSGESDSRENSVGERQADSLRDSKEPSGSHHIGRYRKPPVIQGKSSKRTDEGS